MWCCVLWCGVVVYYVVLYSIVLHTLVCLVCACMCIVCGVCVMYGVMSRIFANGVMWYIYMWCELYLCVFVLCGL